MVLGASIVTSVYVSVSNICLSLWPFLNQLGTLARPWLTSGVSLVLVRVQYIVVW